jgi:DNA topoisomerase VI subunit B
VADIKPAVGGDVVHGVLKVKSCGPAQEKKQASREGSRVVRMTFQTSREMDFFTAEKLRTQTGHAIADWHLVTVKELLDNALDGCEDQGIAPVLEVTADACGIGVHDNGPGLPDKTLQGVMDFTVRASSREAYCAPDRGQQGNALKTLLAMPRVLDPEHGKFIVCAHGKRHAITCRPDPISQRAVVHDDTADLNGDDRGGTLVRLEWRQRSEDGEALWPFADCCLADFKEEVAALLCGFALFNPHATIKLDWVGKVTTWEATNRDWQKWKPCQVTSAHWYEPANLERLIGAFITHDKDAGTERLVTDFLKEFDGLAGSAKRKKVLAETGLARAKLSDLVVDSRLDSGRIATLLEAMKRHTRKVTARRLGVLGEDHLRARLRDLGTVPESFRYARKLDDEGLPGVLESAFGYLGEDAPDERKIYAGANWSAAIANPFRHFGSTGEGLETLLANRRATRDEPIIFVLHLAQPRLQYRDHGKSALVVGGG